MLGGTGVPGCCACPRRCWHTGMPCKTKGRTVMKHLLCNASQVFSSTGLPPLPYTRCRSKRSVRYAPPLDPL
eukprot:139670-Prorocentrum_minimum.AAC.2